MPSRATPWHSGTTTLSYSSARFQTRVTYGIFDWEINACKFYMGRFRYTTLRIKRD